MSQHPLEVLLGPLDFKLEAKGFKSSEEVDGKLVTFKEEDTEEEKT